MEKKLPTVENVLAALPAVQSTVKREIAARIAAGERVGGVDDVLEAQLMKRKRELLAKLQSSASPARVQSKRVKRSAA